MNTEANYPPGDQTAAGRFICDTVDALQGLYVRGVEDTPRSVLGRHPNPVHVVQALQVLLDVMMPGKMSPGSVPHEDLSIFLMRRLSRVWGLLRPEIELALPFRWLGEAARMEGAPAPEPSHPESVRVMRAFLATLAGVRELLTEDIRAAYEGDPAALSYGEVQLAYPGLLAITSHRLAHELYKLDVPIVPRIMSEWTHSQTGIDIHPGATIGHGFFIDHGTGVVVGETTVIGNRVKLYQGVTLGAKSFPLDAQGKPIKHIRRHPTVEDDVVIYANATLFGGETVIGRGSTIGASVFLMESVPPYSIVSAIHPELRIKSTAKRPADPAPPA